MSSATLIHVSPSEAERLAQRPAHAGEGAEGRETLCRVGGGMEHIVRLDSQASVACLVLIEAKSQAFGGSEW
jgi:hypothetical protein